MLLICKKCKHEAQNASEFAHHFNICHRVASKSLFMCDISGCYAQFLTLERFNCHLKDFHKPSNQSAPQTVETTHNDKCDEDLLLKCPFPLCQYKTKSRSTLRSHRYRHHRGTPNTSATVNPFREQQQDLPIQEDCSIFVGDTGSCESGDDVITVEHNPEEEILKSFVHLYLTLTSKYHVPDSTLHFLLQKYHALLKDSLGILTTKLLNQLSLIGISNDNVQRVVETLQDDVMVKFHSPEGPMRSQYMRRKQYTTLFKYISPVSHNLGLNDKNVLRKFHTVPIKETLQFLFNDDSVFEQYTERQSEMHQALLLTDIKDGSLFQKHPVFSNDSSAVQLIVYQDDVELVNPLGCGKCIYKLNTSYYTLGNIHPWSRSYIDPIQLILLAREVDVAYFGLPRILQPVLDELRDLEGDGLRGKNVKVRLLVLLGDNLGTHTVGGFLENPADAGALLEFYQRKIFKIQGAEDGKGSKVERKKNSKGTYGSAPPNMQNRYRTMIKAYDDFCDLWDL